MAEPGDPDWLAKNILVALDKKWDHDKMLSYSNQFTWDKIAEQYAAVFSRLLVYSYFFLNIA